MVPYFTNEGRFILQTNTKALDDDSWLVTFVYMLSHAMCAIYIKYDALIHIYKYPLSDWTNLTLTP